MAMQWKPTWWKQEAHGSAWDRVKEAMHRDWEQTKKDLHLGGHEMNQNAGDTMKQMAGKQSIPSDDTANRPKVIGNWDDVELPIGYGYGARDQYGSQHPAWNERLESTLKSEWESGKSVTKREWNEVRDHVRRGYEYKRS